MTPKRNNEWPPEKQVVSGGHCCRITGFSGVICLYQRLKDLWEDRDMVQKEVAAVLGIDQRVYSNYETGKREIPVKHLIRLAEFYGASVDFILGLTNEVKPYPRTAK